jgi:hypothetical protein
VVNADDYYGKQAYKELYNFLSKIEDPASTDYCMVGYRLGNTVTDHGSVARGVCATDTQGYLTEITHSSSAEDHVEVELTFAVNGEGKRGDVTVSVEQQAVAEYVFTDTKKTGA